MTTFTKHSIFILTIILIVITLIPYKQVGSFDFVNYDDDVYVTENYMVQQGLTAKSIKWAFTTFNTSNWHPLTFISLMLDTEIFGYNPRGFHISNLLIHILNSILLFILLWRITGSQWKSWLVASLFAVHPAHVESVAWISERKDVLSTFFWLVVMLLYFNYAKSRKAKWYLLVVLFFILGSMVKPMIVTLPFVLILMDIWPLKRFAASAVQSTEGKKSKKEKLKEPDIKRASLGSLLIEKIPLFIIMTGSAIITFIAQKHGGAVASIRGLPLELRFKNAIVSYSLYLKKLVWPEKLAVYYPYNESITFIQAGLS